MSLFFSLTPMSKKLKILIRYIKFFFTSDTRFSVHSPFVYSIYEEVFQKFKKTRTFVQLSPVEKICRDLFKSKEKFRTDVTDINKRLRKQKTVGNIAKSISLSIKEGRLLAMLVHKFQPDNIIELGTGMGIGTIHLASVNPKIRVTTIEGDPFRAEIASRVFEKAKLKNISLRVGMFDDILPDVLSEAKQINMAFIDGGHNSIELLRYYNMIKPHLTVKSVVILHDIYWSADMYKAWKKIIKDPDITISIDTFHFGILIYDKKLKKQNVKIRINAL